jgi:hypothetical protein
MRSFVVLLEELRVDARFVVETLEMSVGDELDEIFVAVHVLSQKDEASASVIDTRLHVLRSFAGQHKNQRR